MDCEHLETLSPNRGKTWFPVCDNRQVVQVHDAHRGVMVTTSLGVILFTTVFFGAVMPFFTRGLKPERGTSSNSAFQYSESLGRVFVFSSWLMDLLII